MTRVLAGTTLSGGVTLPTASIAVVTTNGFGTNGRFTVGSQTVAYTGVSGNTFTGCTGGTGAFSAGAAVNALQPADYATVVQCRRPGNLHYPGDAIIVDATTDTAGAPGATTWEARDHFGAVVATGAWSGTSQTIGTHGIAPFGKKGWHRLRLLGPDRGDGAWTTDYGAAMFTLAPDVNAIIPRAPLRVTNPPYQNDGLDAPAMHGWCSLGGFRVSVSPNNLSPQRQQATNSTASGTGVTATLSGGGFGGAVTSASMVVLVHTVVGDDSGMAGDVTNGVTFNTGPDVVVGAGATKVHTRIYYLHAQAHLAWTNANSFPTFTCTTTNASKQSLVVIEMGPYVQNALALAFATSSGTGSSAVLTKDMTSIAGANEYGVAAAVSVDQGGASSFTGIPSVTTSFGVGQIAAGSTDAYGGGQNQTISATLTGSPTNWTMVFVSFLSGVTYASVLAGAQSGLTVRHNAWGQYQDPARPYRKVSIQTLGSVTAQTLFHFTAEISQLVADTNTFVPGFVGGYTGRNEPQGTYSISENTAFAAAVTAGDATAKSLAPGFVALTIDAQPEFFNLCDTGMFDPVTGVDGMDYHDYNMCDSDIGITLNVLRALKSGMDSRGLGNLPIYMTEGGHDTTWWPGIFRACQSGTSYILNMLAREVILKVPYEQQYWYYDQRAGFDSVTTWQMSDGLYPGYAMHLAYADELVGRTLESELSFGDIYDSFIVGGVWRNASDQTGVAAVIAAAGIPDQTFAVGGPLAGVPTTMTYNDCWGNPTTVAVTGRTFSVPVGERPIYVQLPAGVKIAARGQTLGRSWLTVAPMAYVDDGDAGAVIAHLRRLTDDSFLSSYAYGSGDPFSTGNCYYTAGNTTFPRHILVSRLFGPVMPVDTIAAFLPATWQAMGPILKGALDYTTDGGVTWNTAGSWDNSATVTVKTYDLYSDTLCDAYTFPQHYFEASLGGVQNITGVRIRADIGTQGMYLDSMMVAPTGTANPIPASGPGSVPVSLTLAELMAFNKVANVSRPARS